MHQTISYHNQFTPWIPNHSVLHPLPTSADHLSLALEYFALEEDFDKFEHVNDILLSSLYSNGVCHILISKSQKAYKNDTE